MSTEQITAPAGSEAGGFEPLRPYGPNAPGESYAELQARLIAANERAALLEQRLEVVTAELDAAEQRAAYLEDSNRELASDLDDALDFAQAHTNDPEFERLVRQPLYGHAFAGLVRPHTRGQEIER